MTFVRNMRTTEHLTARYGKGSWALVTGGSDGIGLAMSKELARRHFNIVIVGRNKEKMAEAAKKIEAINRCQVRIVEMEFTEGQEVEDY
jgi:17beta-estradiol 17-dehydrogenase / very-long-chain 3-oxoacyl-CoA reductase